MRLEATRDQKLIRDEPDDHAISWSFKIYALSDDENNPEEFVVGRILADELHRYELAEGGEDIWDVADADSSGLEAAWASLLPADRRKVFDETQPHLNVAFPQLQHFFSSPATPL